MNKMVRQVETSVVNMLACSQTSVAVVFAAGDVAAPTPILSTVSQEEQRRLYYYKSSTDSASAENVIPSMLMATRHRRVLLEQRAITIDC